MSDPIRKRVLPPAKIPFLVVQVECEGGKGAPAIPDSLRGQAFSSLGAKARSIEGVVTPATTDRLENLKN